MKNKNKKVIVSVILLIIFVIGIGSITIKADSGWDSSYDYGSSWDSGSSWSSGSSWDSDWDSGWDYDYDYDSGSSSHSGGSSSLGGFAVFVLMAIVVSFIIYSTTEAEKARQKMLKSLNIKHFPSEEEESNRIANEIKEFIPDFTLEQFKNEVFDTYQIIQEAWMNFDYETLKNRCTNELYNQYKSQLEALKQNEEQNIMEVLDQKNFYIRSYEKTDTEIFVKVRTTITCKDYIVDKNGNTTRGNANTVNFYYYEMTLNKKINNVQNKCPSCGAELEETVKDKCPYCRNKIVYESNTNWILSRKQMISQW